jgi:putative endonuclease
MPTISLFSAVAFVYILESETTGRFQVGSTENLERRIGEHQRGKDRASGGRGPRKLVYQGQFEILAEARRRELEIKRWQSSRLTRCQRLRCIALNKPLC